MADDPKRKSWTRTFQSQPQQDDMWYSSIPLDVMWAIYARQSTPAQMLKNSESTEMQTDDLTAWLLVRGVKDGQWKLFDADLGVSGTLPIIERTALQELVELIKADQIKAVLVYQISRLFRDDTGVEYNTFAKICKEHNCVLVTSDGMVFNFSNRMHLKMFRFLAEYAAEYIPQQIGLLHAARMRKARRGFYAGLGCIPRGFIVDYDKNSRTYKKFIPYNPYNRPILHLYERFYALEADLSQFCREVEEMPYVFPLYEPWVDRRNIRDKNWKKVPGGYHITKRGLISLLINPVNIGWFIIKGDVVSTKNHDPLIPPEKQYLFWYAFDHLSEYTTQGEINQKRIIAPRRFYQRGTIDEAGLLKNRIEAPGGRPIYVHLSEDKHSYCTPKQDTKLCTRQESEIAVNLIDHEFTKLFFAHLQETHDFDMFRQWIDEIVQKQTTQLEIIHIQLEEIEQQQEAILDEKLVIRKHINQQIKELLAKKDPTADREVLKDRFEKEAEPEFARLAKRSEKLKEREEVLKSKLPKEEEEQQFKIARTFADFQTEVRMLANVWDEKLFKEKKEFVNLLVKKAVLSVAAPHWVKLTIHWVHPAWASETLFIHRRKGKFTEWTEEEREVLKTHYVQGKREQLHSLLPHKTFSAIKNEAQNLGLRRQRMLAHCPIDEYTSWTDYELCQTLEVSPNSRDTVYIVEDSGTKYDTLSAP